MLGAVFGLLILTRLASAIAALTAGPPHPVFRTPDSQLRTLTVLAPLLHEGEAVIRALVAAIGRLDYPHEKLDVKLLVEADDDATLAAVAAIELPDWFEVVPVPPGAPRTKPKALNYGLASARGDFLCVFDAEDSPAPEQPRAAMAAFQSPRGRNLSVVQAPLLIHNGGDSWLTDQFAVEYAVHFRVWIPFLARLGLPLALGGTATTSGATGLRRPAAGMPGTSRKTPTSAFAWRGLGAALM